MHWIIQGYKTNHKSYYSVVLLFFSDTKQKLVSDKLNIEN